MWTNIQVSKEGIIHRATRQLTRPHNVSELLHLILVAKDDGAEGPSVDAAPIAERDALAKGGDDLAVGLCARPVRLMSQRIGVDLDCAQFLGEVV